MEKPTNILHVPKTKHQKLLLKAFYVLALGYVSVILLLQ